MKNPHYVSKQLIIRMSFIFFMSGISLVHLSAQKFLGNIFQYSAPSNFSQFWNQVTPENSGKWGSCEPSRDSYSWGNLDNAYNYANQNGFPFKGHTLVWGNQEPGWIGGLSQSEQRAEVEEWIRDYFARYPGTDYIDVVNEPLHAPASYRNALGGSGSTGWDWVITAFQIARQYAPSGCKLLINEYGIISNPSAAQDYVNIINLLINHGLIDGIGIQCHAFNMDNVSTSTMNQVLNILSATGLPIYVSELDMRGSDSEQLARYQEKFPVFWNNSNVGGVTLWGYIQGTMWQPEAWLVSSSGSQRPAMQWLMDYVYGGGTGGGANTIVVRARGTAGTENINLRVNDVTIASWTLSTSYQDYSASTDNTGGIVVQFDNDASGRDVQVDYITINGSTRQAENQSYNTGVWQDASCGGEYSEWLHCNGSIGFGDVSASVSNDSGNTGGALGCGECDWYGTDFPICCNTTDGWGWENNMSCIGINTCINVKAAWSSTEEQSTFDFGVFPNPVTDGIMTITLPELNGESLIRFTDLNGKVIKEVYSFNQQTINIELNVNPGMYFVQIVNNESTSVKRVAVK